MPPIPATLLTRLQLVALAALLAASAALPWLAIRYSDHAYVISHRPDAFWISAPQPASRTTAIPIDRNHPPTVRFGHAFELEAVPDTADLWVRALQDWTLSINGRGLPGVTDPDPRWTDPDRRRTDPNRSWKQAHRVELAEHLVPGRNEVEIVVRNPAGPALLQAWSETLPPTVGTGSHWSQNSGGRRGRAVVANDVRIYPAGQSLPDPMRLLEQRWLGVTLLFLLCALPGYFLATSRPSALPAALVGPNLPRTAFLAVSLVFLGLFLRKALEIPLVVGFDGEAHLDYIRFLIEERRIPRADEGWEMFHPPLYHGMAAGLRQLFSAEASSVLDRGLIRLLPILSGLSCAWLAGRTTLRLLPGRPGVAAVAVLAAGLLPMNLYLSVFASNESLHAALVAAGIWITCELLAAPRATLRWGAALSAVLGLALVTKSTTSLPVAAVLIAVVGAKLWLVEGRTPLRAVAATVALTTGPVVLAGWFYLRNWLLFDDPFISNLEAFETLTYWVPPGFHTTPWLTGFGEVFTRPFFSSFHSYGDGFYSSFWGDGYASGRAGVMFPNPWWDYETMATIYPLALPASAILIFGFGVCVVESLRGNDSGRRLGLLTLVVVAVGMLLMTFLATLRIPINAMPKAFYTLPALVCYAVAFAAGTGWLWERLEGRGQPLLRAAISGYLGMLALTITAAFLR